MYEPLVMFSEAMALAVLNVLDFMQIFRKFDKIICWRPLLQGILDPPPYGIIYIISACSVLY